MPRGHKLNPQPKAKSGSGIPASAGHRRWAREALAGSVRGCGGAVRGQGDSWGSGRCPCASSLLFLPHPGAGGRARAAGSSLRLAEGLRSSAAPGRGTR